MRHASILLILAWAGCNDKTEDTGVNPADTDTDTDADSDTDADADADADTDTDADADYSHTIIVDGDIGDFGGGEYFQSSTPGSSSYMAWDDQFFYVGLYNEDVLADENHHVLVYLSDTVTPGTWAGVAFNTQQPELPFDASYLLRWDATGTNGWYAWDGTSWVETPAFLGTQASAVAESESFRAVEFKLPFALFGADASGALRAHICWIDDANQHEQSYAATPWQSFFDRPDPDYTQYYEFDLHGSQFPNNYVALEAIPHTDTGLAPPDSGETGDTGGGGGFVVGPWRNDGITVDGNASDFLPGEQFPTTAGVVNGVDSSLWVSWNDANVYLAARHTDVENGGSKQHLVIYLGNGTAGAGSGITIGSQRPNLPFQANYAVEFRADYSYDGLWKWDGVQWVEQPYFFSTGTDGSAMVEQNALQTVEMSIPWTSIGLSSHLLVHASWLDEQTGSEVTYSGSPVGSFTEGAFDPNYSLYWNFDLNSTQAPGFELPLDSAGNPVGTPPYARTAVVDGDATEYPVEEDFTTSTGGVKAHVTWDATDLFVAYEQPAIVGGTSDQWFVMYVGNGTAGSLTGLSIGGQQPSLAFQANYALKWNADDSVNSLYHYLGGGWVEDKQYLGTGGSAYVEAEPKSTFEFSIPLGQLGVTTIADLNLAWVDDRLGFQTTQGGVPSGSFVDGFDPNYASYYSFVLDTPTAPSSYSPLP